MHKKIKYIIMLIYLNILFKKIKNSQRHQHADRKKNTQNQINTYIKPTHKHNDTYIDT